MRLKILLEKIPHVVYLFTGLIILFSLHFSQLFFDRKPLEPDPPGIRPSDRLPWIDPRDAFEWNRSLGGQPHVPLRNGGWDVSFERPGIDSRPLLGILIGLASGFFIGFLVTRLGFSPFIATFGMMGVFEGISLFSNKGESIYWSESVFNFIGSGYLFNVPFPVWLAALTFVIVYVFLYKTPFGVNVYAIGGHEEGLRLSGVNVRRQKVLIYMVSGLLASIGGIVLSSRIASGHPTVGIGYEFEAIASSVIGGTTFFGGQGGIVGTLFGALMITLLRNGLNLLGYTTPYQYCAIGVILAVGITLNTLYKR